MGMDVCGIGPANKAGEYFSNNVWWWRPLADYCMSVAPDIAARCKYWHSNDGDGLGNKNSQALADVLQREIDTGRCKAYARIREAELTMLPNDVCHICAGAGEMTAKQINRIEQEAGRVIDLDGDCGFGPPHKYRIGEKCHLCKGTGSVEPWAHNYEFSVENVQGFVTFLRACGGFQIW